MNIIRYPLKNGWAELLKRPVLDNRAADLLVLPILEEVKKRGDEALIEFTSRFDKVDLTTLQVSEDEFNEAFLNVDDELKKSVETAVRNIEAFHLKQMSKTEKVRIDQGIECWQKFVPIQKVGFYIPGGTAPLFSTVLMLSVPARIAGCEEIVICSPPSKGGKIHPAILYAAKITGIKRVFKIGGAHAIAAMAYGTSSVPKVFKIYGPGNQFVMAAKQIVSRSDVAIDMPAGPSEVAVIADETADPCFVASDLLSQAEHGTDSQVLLFTTSENVAIESLKEVEKQLEMLPRKEIAKASLANSKIFLLKTIDEIMEMVNEYAPEHLIIATKNADELGERVKNAGSVFLGNYSTESAGDYASGTNHTLPTNGYAKAYSGINIDSFVKKITYQKLSQEGLRSIGPAIMKMAETENLMAHKNAVFIRLNK